MNVSDNSNTEHRIRRHIENLASEDKKVSVRAENNLIRYYGVRALPHLIAACDDRNPQVRFRAVWALASTRDPRALKTVLRLTNDPDESVRYDATMALGVLQDERAIGELVEIAIADDHTRPAVAALWDFGPPAIPALRRLLAAGSPGVRWEVTQGLGNIALKHKSSECLDLLRECLSDPDADVGENARDWLENELASLS